MSIDMSQTMLQAVMWVATFAVLVLFLQRHMALVPRLPLIKNPAGTAEN